jgi:hypothetical protein
VSYGGFHTSDIQNVMSTSKAVSGLSLPPSTPPPPLCQALSVCLSDNSLSLSPGMERIKPYFLRGLGHDRAALWTYEQKPKASMPAPFYSEVMDCLLSIFANSFL